MMGRPLARSLADDTVAFYRELLRQGRFYLVSLLGAAAWQSESLLSEQLIIDH
jgi:hypothetical protein